ncbi:MAG: phosphoribosyltransferase [Nitrospirae bacterium CG_4_10_14_0_8_um_filter_41_23]|nr:phosphoribosyltransferase [Nitrospirota bacterium]PIY86139.1 MAG: phosphoribosyltransferase [Nitrospirae bacterium CG_4_10_14_0_8_um_filter_41_23]
MIYKDRKDAGIQLVSRLTEYKDREDVLVLALPREGVVIGYEVAKALNCPLDIIIIRKIGFPGQPELAIGAVSETGAVVLNEDIISAYKVSKDYIEEEILRQKKEISRRITLYRSGKGIPPLDGKIIILVDDGVATGATIKAAISTLKKEKIVRLVAALPVSSEDAEEGIKQMVDEWVCTETPFGFMAIGNYYQDFSQVSDEEVVELLKQKTKD